MQKRKPGTNTIITPSDEIYKHKLWKYEDGKNTFRVFLFSSIAWNELHFISLSINSGKGVHFTNVLRATNFISFQLLGMRRERKIRRRRNEEGRRKYETHFIATISVSIYILSAQCIAPLSPYIIALITCYGYNYLAHRYVLYTIP